MKKFLVCLLALTLIGCASKRQYSVTLYPITTQDIFTVPKGSIIKTPKEEIVVQKDGRFLSDFYIDEVMDAEVK
jgi:uncharacterized lipoprotein YmbA